MKALHLAGDLGLLLAFATVLAILAHWIAEFFA
jgi:hypothetical protein